MEVRNNYNECLTNLACSIRKYFGLNIKHNTLDYLAIGKTNKALLYTGSTPLVSQHAGYTNDEIYVPIILIKTRK